MERRILICGSSFCSYFLFFLVFQQIFYFFSFIPNIKCKILDNLAKFKHLFDEAALRFTAVVNYSHELSRETRNVSAPSVLTDYLITFFQKKHLCFQFSGKNKKILELLDKNLLKINLEFSS